MRYERPKKIYLLKNIVSWLSRFSTQPAWELCKKASKTNNVPIIFNIILDYFDDDSNDTKSVETFVQDWERFKRLNENLFLYSSNPSTCLYELTRVGKLTKIQRKEWFEKQRSWSWRVTRWWSQNTYHWRTCLSRHQSMTFLFQFRKHLP